VFGPQDEILHLQFAGEYRLYSRNLFVRHPIADLERDDGRSPNALQPERAQALFSRLRGRDEGQLARLERELMAAQIRQGKRVFLIAPEQKNRRWLAFSNAGLDGFDGLSFATWQLALWRGPGADRPDGGEPEGEDWQLLEVTAAPRGERAPQDQATGDRAPRGDGGR
jgi:hypothetical protein